MDWHPLEEAGHFASIDRHFAELMAKLANEPSPLLKLACAEASAAIRRGDSCADLSRPRAYESTLDDGRAPKILAELPALAKLLPQLSPVVVGRPGERKPLILDGDRLYLFRYYDYEQRLATALRARAAAGPAADFATTGPLLDRLFPEKGEQRAAAETALRRGLTILTGGPGTGKTYTAARILAALFEAAPPGRRPRVALCAPTGKAALRLQESLLAAKSDAAFPAAAREGLPAEAVTLHRLLGSISGSHNFRHHAKNPIPYDWVVVDEASMVDLSLMTKFFEALAPEARVILLGDKDQLSSVEAGNVLSDLCLSAALKECVVQLSVSRRFSKESGIGALSRAINGGSLGPSFDRFPDLSLEPLPKLSGLKGSLSQKIEKALGPFFEAVAHYRPGVDEAGKVLPLFQKFKILCALRGGPFGATAVNRLVETLPGVRRLRGFPAASGEWYPGRPVMVTQNDYALGLFNGDMGIALPTPEGALKVFFSSPGGFAPGGLPAHELAFASTVHKVQGSEFEEVLLILPDRWSEVLSRPLLYTAVTRAVHRFSLWSPDTILKQSVETPGNRVSGLRKALG